MIKYSDKLFEEIRDKQYKKNRPSSKLIKAQEIPHEVIKKDFGELLAYNGLWLILTYGSDLLSMINPWIGKAFGQLIKFRYRGKWEQKTIGNITK